MDNDTEAADACARDIFADVAAPIHRTLQPHFARYETLARLSSPNLNFRHGIAVAIGKYFVLATEASGQPGRRARQRRSLVERVEIRRRAMLDLNVALSGAAIDPKNAAAIRQQAARNWRLARDQFDSFLALPRTRGRRALKADEMLILDVGAIYQRASGRDWTITENRARADRLGISTPYTGAFADLLSAVQADARCLFAQIDLAIVRSLSSNIIRQAKRLRSRSVMPKNPA